MRKIQALFLLIALSLLNGVHADTEKPEDSLVIIGEQMDFREIKDDGSCGGEVKSEKGVLMAVCVQMDKGISVRYSILEVLQGKFDGKTIEFEAYDHYGIPPFSQYQIAMIYLEKEGGQWYQKKYEWNKVYKTTDGRYADCSLDWVSSDEEQVEVLKPVEFQAPVYFDITHLSGRLKEQYATSPLYVVRGNLVTCQRGYYAEDMLRDRFSRR